MGALNKERIVFIVTIIIAIYGLSTAFSGHISLGSVPDVPPPGGERNVPTINIVKADFIEGDFNSYWGKYGFNDSRDPWVPSKKTSRPTAKNFPMREPSLSSSSKVVPPTPFSPLLRARRMIRQFKSPLSIEQEQTEDGSEEDSDEEG